MKCSKFYHTKELKRADAGTHLIDTQDKKNDKNNQKPYYNTMQRSAGTSEKNISTKNMTHCYH